MLFIVTFKFYELSSNNHTIILGVTLPFHLTVTFCPSLYFPNTESRFLPAVHLREGLLSPLHLAGSMPPSRLPSYFGHHSAENNRNLYGLPRFANYGRCTNRMDSRKYIGLSQFHIPRQCKIHCSKDFWGRTEVWPRRLGGVSTQTSFTLRGLGLHISPLIAISCHNIKSFTRIDLKVL
jgi:hypothetical protein